MPFQYLYVQICWTSHFNKTIFSLWYVLSFITAQITWEVLCFFFFFGNCVPSTEKWYLSQSCVIKAYRWKADRYEELRVFLYVEPEARLHYHHVVYWQMDATGTRESSDSTVQSQDTLKTSWTLMGEMMTLCSNSTKASGMRQHTEARLYEVMDTEINRSTSDF